MGDNSSEERRLIQLEEAFLVAEAQAGGNDAFVRLVDRYERPLLYFLRRLVPEGDAALDLHQEVWLDAFRGLKSLQAPEAFRVWIYQIARRKAARFIRREVYENPSVAEDVSADDLAFDPPEIPEAEAVHQALHLLPGPYREVLVLHYLKDFSMTELAAVLGCPPGTVKSRLHHARIALRRVLERKSP